MKDYDNIAFGEKAGESITTGVMNVIIGANSDTGIHSGCVLIGTNLKAERDYQIKIGNNEVEISRQMTAEEFLSIYRTFAELKKAWGW